MFTRFFYVAFIYLSLPLDVLYSKNFIIHAQESLFSDSDEKFELKVSNIESRSADLSWKIPPKKLDYIRALRLNCSRTESKLEAYRKLHDNHIILSPNIDEPSFTAAPLESASKYSCVLIGAVSLNVGTEEKLIVLSKVVTFMTPLDKSDTKENFKNSSPVSTTNAIILVTVVPTVIIILTIILMVLGYYLHKKRLKSEPVESGEEPLLRRKKKKINEHSKQENKKKPVQRNTNHNNRNMQQLNVILPPKVSSSNHKQNSGRDFGHNAPKQAHYDSHCKNIEQNSNTHGSKKNHREDRFTSSEHHSKTRGDPSRFCKYSQNMGTENGSNGHVGGMTEIKLPSCDLKYEASRSTIISTASCSTRQSSVGLGVPPVTNKAIQRSFCNLPKKWNQLSIPNSFSKNDRDYASEDCKAVQTSSMYTRTVSAPNIIRKQIRSQEGLELPASSKNHYYQKLPIEQ